MPSIYALCPNRSDFFIPANLLSKFDAVFRKRKEPAILGNYPEPSDISNHNDFFIILRIECLRGYFVLYKEKTYIKRGIFPSQRVFFKFKHLVRLLYISLFV